MVFPADPSHLGTVRDFARRAAVSLGAQVDLDVLAVLVGELAANAAVHQSDDAEITLELVQGGMLLVTVCDHSEELPRVSGERPWSTAGHRGIQLVAALAQDWGVDSATVGKRVWARLAPIAS